MNVAGIGGGSLIDIIQRLDAATASNSTTGAGSSTSTGSTSDTVSISNSSNLLSKLQQLKTQDPAEFTQLMTSISQELKTAAQQETDSSQAGFLSGLASKFQSVANGGDLSQLAPQTASGNSAINQYLQNSQSSAASSLTSGAGSQLSSTETGHHHHHHHLAGAQSSSSSSSDSTIQQLMASISDQISQAASSRLARNGTMPRDNLRISRSARSYNRLSSAFYVIPKRASISARPESLALYSIYIKDSHATPGSNLGLTPGLRSTLSSVAPA